MKCILLILWLFVWTFLGAQPTCRLMFYNVENLFDTTDDPLTADEEFTPQGNKYWTKARYTDKLLKLARVIAAVGENELPVFVALAEVENRRVLEDLTTKTILSKANYAILHQDSPDKRGIDVAFLYRKDYFHLLEVNFLQPLFPEDTTFRTRDILYASGRLDTDTFYFFVCHFPSMSGGEQQSEWKRERAAEVVKNKVDAIWNQHPSAKIILLGDLNGKANTRAQKRLGAKNPEQFCGECELYNLGIHLLKKNIGTYRFKGRWQTIDHILVSGGLLHNSSGWGTTSSSSIYSASFLLEEDTAHFGYKPFPTYRGPRYIGGYSDHLPIFLDMIKPPQP
ncbi:MAG: endonuclease [Odoribacter sp.]